MASSRQNDDFAEEVLVNNPLDRAIEWISSYLEPAEVFSEPQLRNWAETHGFVEPSDDGDADER